MKDKELIAIDAILKGLDGLSLKEVDSVLTYAAKRKGLSLSSEKSSIYGDLYKGWGQRMPKPIETWCKAGDTL